jgi:DNA-binding response OmpR family regulator
MADYKALVVDYEPRGIRQLREPLESAGFEVHVAQDGEAGRKAFDRLKPDIALIEAMLPKRHGFDLCADLKKTPHGAVTPIVIVTSVYRGRKYRQQALHQYKCDEFMEKPVDAERLLATVNRLLERSGRGSPAEVLPEAPPVAAPATAHARPAEADETEDEISRRLDELLGGGGETGSGTPRASLGFGKGPNLLPFDRERLRDQVVPGTTGPRSVTTSPDVSSARAGRTAQGGAGQAHAHAVVPRAVAPQTLPEHDPGPRRVQPPAPHPRRRAPAQPPPSKRTRLLVFLLVLAIGLAVLSSLL